MIYEYEEALDFLTQKLLDEPGTTARWPERIIKHSIAVSEQAGALGERISQKGWPVDVGLVRVGGLLHDVGRKVYQTIRHGHIGSLILEADGWGYEVANIAANHALIPRDLACSLSLPKRHYAPFTREEAIVTFVDKIMAEDVIIGRQGRRRQLDAKYRSSKEGEGWYPEWSDFCEPEAEELEDEVGGYLSGRSPQMPSLQEALGLLASSFSRIRDPGKREGITKHSLGVCAYSRMIGEDLGLDEHDLELVTYAGLLHDVGRGSAWAVEHPLVGKRMLEPRGYPDEVVRATIGHCIFPESLAEKLRFPKPWDAYRPQTLLEEIVTYADKRIYLDQFLPDCETRFRIWDKLYREGENYPLWSPGIRSGLQRIQERLDHSPVIVSCTSKEIDARIETLFRQYGINQLEAFQRLNIDGSLIKPYTSIVDI